MTRISLFSALASSPELDARREDYATLAAGLARLMRRCSLRHARREFRAALHAHRVLQVRLRLRVPVRLSAALLSDLSHEVAPYVEPAVRAAALRCLQVAARGHCA
ncbi:hypothetical protein HHL11_14910 [Ramlibacter sp. G-1-2-2]|uniref:Uncharacterized protein n=1 Tax=Ramlibacter agri TaxID=2728837 RepID=A0A848H241_9BURK|nr:hypothetical protein [Ramlibacter agri]NML45046.1 hypothetical protein [Ramlibacter agri]